MLFLVQIIDADDRPVPGAVLSVSFPRRRMESYDATLEATGAEGESALTIPDREIERLLPQRARYVVSHKGETHRAVVDGTPRDLDDKTRQVVLRVPDLAITPPRPRPRDGALQPDANYDTVIQVKTGDDAPLAGSVYQMELKDGKEQTLLKLEGTLKSAPEISFRASGALLINTDWGLSSLDLATSHGTVYRAADTSRPAQEDGRIVLTWTLRPHGGPSYKPRLVTGEVTRPDGQGMNGLVVEALDIAIGEETSLGTDKTGRDGSYRITYGGERLRDPARGSADLVVRVSDGDGQLLAESPLIARAAATETVDFALGEGELKGASLFIRIARAVAPVLDKTWPGALRPRDVELLGNRTGLARRLLAEYCAAWRIAGEIESKEDKAVAAAMFGWLHGGLPPDRARLLANTDDMLHRHLAEAQQENFVPEDIDPGRVLARIRSNDPGLAADLAEDFYVLLELAGIDRAHGAKIMAALTGGGLLAARWTAVAEITGQGPADRLRVVVDIWTMLDRDAQLTKAVVDKHDPRATADLSALAETDLAERVKAADVDLSEVDGATSRARLATYAADLARGIEARFAHETFLHQLSLAHVDPLEAALEILRADPGLRLDSPPGSDDEDEAVSALRELYAVGPVFRRAATVATLARAGFMTARQIVETGRPEFIDRMAKPLGRTESARVFNRALALDAAADAARARALVARPIDGETDLTDPTTLLGQLFRGSVSAACDHCASVLGPAAYLVDLYAFVGLARGRHDRTGQDEIDARRPDLVEMHATCANSDRVLPYVDLVLELLENHVAPRAATSPVPQTTREVPDLLARPEHVNGSAYEALRDATFPWGLPFDRDVARMRAYLEKLGVSLAELRAPQVPGAARTAHLAARIGLHRPDTLVTDGKPGRIARGFGKATLSALRRITRLQDLAAHLLIDQEPLLELIATAFVSPDEIVLLNADLTLNWSELTSDRLERLLLIGRLHARTGFAIDDLDALLRAIGLPTSTTLQAWLEDFAAGLDLIDALGVTHADMPLFVTGNAVPALADAAGESAEAIGALADHGHHDLSRLSGIETLRRDLELLTMSGLSASGALDLLRPPTADGPFGKTPANTLLEALEDELTKLYRSEHGDTDAVATLHGGYAEVAAILLGEAFGSTAETVRPLLDADDAKLLRQAMRYAGLPYEEAATTPPEDLSADDLQRLWKQCTLMDATGLGPSEALALSRVAADYGLIDPAAIADHSGGGAQSLDPLLNYLRYQDVNLRVFASEEDSLFARLALIASGAEIAETLTVPGVWETTDLATLAKASHLALADEAALSTKQGILALDRLLGAARTLECRVEEVWALVETDDGDLAEQLLMSRFGGDFTVLEEANAPLREAMRDALLAHVMHESRSGSGPRFDRVEDVYDHFLIDPEMSAGYRTSRIKQACASLQQFVMRVQLGLEGDLALAEDHAREWQWRRNYRVWEANRKVFLFPENWIEPDLRDNKTELYEALEDALQQDDVTSETAESALIDYARGLHRLSNLQMVGLLDDTETGTVYVFARTRDLPHAYFWCQRSANGLWSGWAKLGLEIEGNHMLPVIYNGRIFLFWCNFAEKLDSENRDYVNELALLQAQEDAYRNGLNSEQRKIDDARQKQAEYEDMAAETNYFVWQQTLYRTIADTYGRIAETAETEYQAQLDGLAETKADIADLRERFTYFDVDLSWTQYHRLSGWSAPTRSRGKIDTILAADPAGKTHYRSLERFHLRRLVDGETLTILLSTGAGTYGRGELEHQTVDFGTFTLDIVNEVLEAEDARVYAPYAVPQIVAGASRHEQAHTLGWHTPFAMVSGDGETSDRLFEQFSHSAGVQVVPATRAFDDIGNAPALVSALDRSYFIEPTGPALKPRAPAARRKAMPAAPRRIEGGQLLENAPVEAARTATRSFGRNVGAVPGLPAATDVAPSRGPILVDATAGATPADPVRDVMQPRNVPVPNLANHLASERKWRFVPIYHPFTDITVTALFRDGLEGLYVPDVTSGRQIDRDLDRQSAKVADAFTDSYNPTDNVALPRPGESFVFDRTSPYAVYNWELFFHAPFEIAAQLTRNRKFADARDWLHFIFNPNSREGGTNHRMWRFGPFEAEHARILAGSAGDPASMSEEELAQFNAQVEEWQRNPFNPHAVARLRTLAYMRATYMAYLDNLIAWADDLFSRDTMESINEATQLYVLAAQLLGQEPMTLPEAALAREPRSVGDVLAGERPTVYVADTGKVADPGRPKGPATGFFKVFSQMCLPSNDRLTDYWRTLSDRLFKIRHCMNIDGILRQLPLYQPPIDPALLVRATSAGVSVSDALAMTSAGRPHYRFTFMLQKALEFTADVKALGMAILAALEKRDSEELAQLRARHEVAMGKRMRDIRAERVREAEAARDGIQRAHYAAQDRRDHYRDLLDSDLLPQETKELKKLRGAHRAHMVGGGVKAIASVLSSLPEVGFNGPIPKFEIGGKNFGPAMNAIAEVSSYIAMQHTHEANMQGREAQHLRRRQDWQFQKAQAERDMSRLDKDLVASEIRLAIAERELEDQEHRIAQAEEAAAFLEGKFTNAELYGWMTGNLAGLHYQSYKLAHDLARQAEACMAFELGDVETGRIGFGAWDSLRKGLLAGERLTLDLRQLEAAYLAANKRSQELTKNVSLARLAPAALLDLQSAATCSFEVPEFLFDIDHPGHYRRRIKAVSLTIPAVAGPQTTIGCSLKLEESMIRRRPDYTEDAEDRMGAHQVISTSGGQNDAGMFQLDFRDERYLPFEGMGAVSRWTLALPPTDLAQFDYATISDVILHIRYTSEIDEGFRDEVIGACTGALDVIATSFDNQPDLPLSRLFSLRFDFPVAWSHAAGGTGPADVTLDLSPDRFPYLFARRAIILTRLEFRLPSGSEEIEIGQASAALPVTLPEPVTTALRDGATDIPIIAHYAVS